MKSSVERKIIDRLSEFVDALGKPQPIAEQFTCRRRVVRLKPKPYDPQMVKKVRKKLNCSQSAFAIFLGVAPKTVQAWESGDLAPNKMACRFMDEIQRNPSMYRAHLEEMFTRAG